MQRALSLAMVSLVLLGAASAGGCSSSDAAPSLSAEAACASYAKAFCAKVASCSPYVTTLLGVDCEARLTTSCKTAISAPSTSTTPDTVDACAKSALGCGNIFDEDPNVTCAPKPGGIEDGKGCGESAQCKSGFCAVSKDNAICGTCSPKIAAGAACVNDDCPAGLDCVDGKCLDPVYDGGPCGTGATSFCGFGFTCVASKCVPAVATAGAACKTDGTAADCDGNKGLLCIQDKCEEVKFAKAGEECGAKLTTDKPPKLASLAVCEAGGYCKGATFEAGKLPTLGKCEPVAADGAACAEGDAFNVGPKCRFPARCVGGVCKLSDPASCK